MGRRKKKVQPRKAGLPEQDERVKAMRRLLGTAAALETCGGYDPLPAWELAKSLPETVQLALCVAARCPIASEGRLKVRDVLRQCGVPAGTRAHQATVGNL